MKNKNDLISVIVNCYNEEETILIFYKKVKPILENIKGTDYEFIFIDDNSSDNTLNIIKKLAKNDKKVKYVSTSRRFGKEAGILAGYENAKGDYIVAIDVDLQDPPELIEEMYKKLKQDSNYDCIATRSVTRKGYPILRKIFTKLYYDILKFLTPLEMKEGIRDYRMITKRVAQDIISMREYNRYSRYLFEYLGYNTFWIEFDNQERSAGTTKWNFLNLFQVAMEAILTSSLKPLYFSVILGLILLFISIILSIVILFIEETVKVFIITALCFFTSIILIGIGIVSLYLSKMYLEIKNRPKYVVKETNIK